MTVHVVRITDEPIPEWDGSLCVPPGEVGEFVIRGPVVTRLYYNRPDAAKLAKIYDPEADDVLHRMGDVGYVDDRGRLWFCGRKSHRVVTPHGTLFTDMVEPVFNTVPGVFRTALVGVTRGGVTYPVVCVEVNNPTTMYSEVIAASINGDVVVQRVLDQLRSVGQAYDHVRQIHTFLFHPGFPVDVRHNSKIFREKLAVWADHRLGPKWDPGARS